MSLSKFLAGGKTTVMSQASTAVPFGTQTQVTVLDEFEAHLHDDAVSQANYSEMKIAELRTLYKTKFGRGVPRGLKKAEIVTALSTADDSSVDDGSASKPTSSVGATIDSDSARGSSTDASSKSEKSAGGDEPNPDSLQGDARVIGEDNLGDESDDEDEEPPVKLGEEFEPVTILTDPNRRAVSILATLTGRQLKDPATGEYVTREQVYKWARTVAKRISKENPPEFVLCREPTEVPKEENSHDSKKRPLFYIDARVDKKAAKKDANAPVALEDGWHFHVLFVDCASVDGGSPVGYRGLHHLFNLGVRADWSGRALQVDYRIPRKAQGLCSKSRAVTYLFRYCVGGKEVDDGPLATPGFVPGPALLKEEKAMSRLLTSQAKALEVKEFTRARLAKIRSVQDLEAICIAGVAHARTRSGAIPFRRVLAWIAGKGSMVSMEISDFLDQIRSREHRLEAMLSWAATWDRALDDTTCTCLEKHGEELLFFRSLKQTVLFHDMKREETGSRKRLGAGSMSLREKLGDFFYAVKSGTLESLREALLPLQGVKGSGKTSLTRPLPLLRDEVCCFTPDYESASFMWDGYDPAKVRLVEFNDIRFSPSFGPALFLNILENYSRAKLSQKHKQAVRLGDLYKVYIWTSQSISFPKSLDDATREALMSRLYEFSDGSRTVDLQHTIPKTAEYKPKKGYNIARCCCRHCAGRYLDWCIAGFVERRKAEEAFERALARVPKARRLEE